MSQWLVHLTQTMLNPTALAMRIPPVYSLTSAAKKQYTQLFQLLEPDRIALICLQEMTKISNYDSNLSGVPAMKLAGLPSTLSPSL
jgi:hypothetical protein